MLVKDRMTSDPVTVSPDDTLGHALELSRSRRIRHLPVVTGNRRLCGILSDRDIRSAMPSLLAAADEQRASFLSGTPVATVMSRDVVTVLPHEPIESAARLMHRHRIGALPVVDHQGRLHGIVTETDILHTFVEILGGAQPSSRIEVALADEPGELARVMQILGGQLGINIISAVVPSFRNQDRTAAILHVGTINPQAAIKALESAGFTVGWPSLDADLRTADAV